MRTAPTADTRRGRWIAVATTLLAATVDLLFGVEASLIVPLVFGPFVASALGSVRDTAGVAVMATSVAVILGWMDETIGTSPHAVRVASVVVGGMMAVWLAKNRIAREQQLRAVTRVAEVAQQTVLHELPATIRRVGLAARYLSASSEAQIGGDFYDALETPWGLRLVVGDVRGKGLDAVRLASALLGEFRSRANSEPELTAVVKSVDAAGSRASDNAGEDFATALFVQLDGDLLTIIRCGHPLPLLAQGRAVHPVATSPSLPLCLGTEASSDEVRLAPGSRILFFSDGAFEGRDAKGDYFDLQSSFARHAGTPHLGAVLDAIVVDLDRHCDGGISDDVVLLIAEQPVDPSSDRPA
jgi:phosphoserine phosphatase RsbU/P